MAPSWQQRQEAVCHPFNHADPDTLWTHPSNWIKQFIFTFSTFWGAFFKHIMSHPMRGTPWKHQWAHAVGKNDALINTLFFFFFGGISIPKMFIIGKKVWPFFWRSYEDVSKGQVENKASTMLCLSLMSHDVISDHNSNDEKCWPQLRCFIFQLQGPVVFMSWCPVDPERTCVFNAWMCTSRLSQTKALKQMNR